MKKIEINLTNLLTSIILVLCCFSTINIFAQFGGGNGTLTNPYIISTPAHLAQLATYVNAGNTTYNSKYYKLNNDISLSGYVNWTPIGFQGESFQGNFDGNNKKVQNLTINRPTENGIGLFGYVTNAIIQNLGVENCDITGGDGIGGLVGQNISSTIINCYTIGKIEGTHWFVGGLVGQSQSLSTISNSYANCNVNGSQHRVGGLVGDNDENSIINNCYATSNVAGYWDVGGLVGYNENTSTISNCYATGNVQGSNYVGGIAGSILSNSVIKNCVAANARIIANSDINRIVGRNSDGNGIYQNNYASNTMLVNGNIITTNNLNGVEGFSQSLTTLQTQSFYTTPGYWTSGGTWNFSTIWQMCSNSFPFFKYQSEIYWNGIVNYNVSQTICLNVIMTGNTTINVAADAIVTVNGVISSTNTYTLTKSGAGTLILNGVNTYTGVTAVSEGILQIGNGTSGSISNTANVILSTANSTLRFEPGSSVTFSKVISGAGKLEYKGAYDKELRLTATNTYTGTTTIETGGYFCIGENTTTGSVAGNIIVQSGGEIEFYRSNDYTYSGVISGAGKVAKAGTGKVTLTGANTYTGATEVRNGTLQIGDGTSTVASIGTTSGVTINSGTTLYFNLATALTFSKIIGGTGSVTQSGDPLYLTGNNTYTGITTINGDLYIGNNTPSGAIAGNIVNNNKLVFMRSDAYTYLGIISGTGWVDVDGVLTLTGVNTYTGDTYIYQTLLLGTNGTIAASNKVKLMNNTSKFDIQAGNKTIKGLECSEINAELILGTRTLTIDNTTAYTFAGKISGTGGVTKSGSGSFTITNTGNTASGTFAHSAGTVVLNGCKWAGNYAKASGTILTITDNSTISGILTLQGGNMNMNLNGSTPSKLTVNGAVTASGTNTINVITTNAQTNYVLIQAGSGISTLTPYTLAYNTSWPDATLNINSPTQLRYSTTSFVPVINITGVPTTATATLQQTLTGTVVPSNATNQNITWSVVNQGTTGATINGNTFNTTNSGTASVRATIINGSTPTSPYTQDFTITVTKATLGGTVSITGSAVFGQTLTVVAAALTSTPIIPALGTLSYQWRRGTTNITGATASTYTLVQADIGQTINVQVTAANCTGTIVSSNTATVTKATQTAPVAPTMASNTSTSITLNTIMGGEYNINGGAYQNSSTFSSLAPNTSYSFRQRLAETDTHFVSPESPIANFSTQETEFIVVTNIIDVPTTATATLPLTITGTVVPNNATNQNITWSVVNPGTTGATITGNTFNTINSGTASVRATIINGSTPTSPYTQDFTIMVTKATLDGTVSITGSAVFGQTLTAVAAALTSTPIIPALGTLSYQWRRGTTTITGATASTYTLVQGDIGQTINVQVTAANCTNTITSSNTETVTKATQIDLVAPTMASNTSTSITLNIITGGEYNINGGTYQVSPSFIGLTPNTSYNFTQRMAETATHLPSPESPVAQFTTSFNSDFCDGSGTEEDPYQICSPEQLAYLAEFVNTGNSTDDLYFKLMNDIDLSGYTNDEGWTPIGASEYPEFFSFQGNFNGNNKIVKNLTINTNGVTKVYIGLFGNMNNGFIQNLGVENCNIIGDYNVGGLVGRISQNCSISNCYATGNVNSNIWNGGGLVGANDGGNISNCYARVSVGGIGGAIGGLVGTNIGTISNCFATGNVNVYGNYVGGFVGQQVGSMQNCYATGNVNGYNNVGGLAGSNTYSSTSNCFATGNISGYYKVGGLMGNNLFSSICNCYATSNVSGNDCVGGLIGGSDPYYDGSNTISNCYASGNIIGNENVGGLVGDNFIGNTISNCVAANISIIAIQNTSNINRITGESSICHNNYAYNAMIVQSNGINVPILDGSNAAGIGKDMQTLRNLVFYNTGSYWCENEKWNIQHPDGIWMICDDIRLPFLRWQNINCNDYLSAPIIITETLPDGTVGTYYIKLVEATGTTVIHWSLVNGSGELPTGLNLSNLSGTIYGTPTAEGTFPFTVKAENVAGYYTKQFSIKINNSKNDDATLSASELQNTTVYPNPTTGQLTIDASTGSATNAQLAINNIDVFDIYGRKLSSFISHSSPLISIDISHLQAGIYFLQVNEKMLKVVKQ